MKHRLFLPTNARAPQVLVYRSDKIALIVCKRMSDGTETKPREPIGKKYHESSTKVP